MHCGGSLPISNYSTIAHKLSDAVSRQLAPSPKVRFD